MKDQMQISRMNTALLDIEAERVRQVEKEGWTQAHDDSHKDGQLADAAACYAATESSVMYASEGGMMYDLWPANWDRKWNKRSKHDRRRQLVIAGALIVAELERLARGK